MYVQDTIYDLRHQFSSASIGLDKDKVTVTEDTDHDSTPYAKAQQTPSPCCASRGFSELTKNVIRSSHGHTFPENFIQIGLAVFS